MANYMRNEAGDVLYETSTGNTWVKSSEPHPAFTAANGWQYDNSYVVPPAWAGALMLADAEFVASVFAN